MRDSPPPPRKDRFFDDLRVKHHHVTALVVKGDDSLVDPDHVGCHTYTAVLVGS